MNLNKDTLKKIVKSSIKIKIPIITFYVFSSENWKRPKKEVNFLFKLIKSYFSKEIENIKKQGIKINIFGELNKLNSELKHVLKKSVDLTKNNKKIIVNLAINYGSRNEIFKTLKNLKKKTNLKTFEKNLYTKNMPHPDILIRTGGRNRLSNFMLWQAAYAEFVFQNTLWPDFTKETLCSAIDEYYTRDRRYGARP